MTKSVRKVYKINSRYYGVSLPNEALRALGFRAGRENYVKLIVLKDKVIIERVRI